jgi:hypothetical protein
MHRPPITLRQKPLRDHSGPLGEPIVTPALGFCRPSECSASFASRMVLRDEESRATAFALAVIPNAARFLCPGWFYGARCLRPDAFDRDEESRVTAARGANAPSSPDHESSFVGAGFSRAPGQAHATAGAHGNGRPRPPFFQVHSAVIPTTTENRPFLIAWLIARGNQCRRAPSGQEFNGIRFSNRLYIVSLGGGPKSRLFCTFLGLAPSARNISERLEGAVN